MSIGSPITVKQLIDALKLVTDQNMYILCDGNRVVGAEIIGEYTSSKVLSEMPKPRYYVRIKTTDDE